MVQPGNISQQRLGPFLGMTGVGRALPEFFRDIVKTHGSFRAAARMIGPTRQGSTIRKRDIDQGRDIGVIVPGIGICAVVDFAHHIAHVWTVKGVGCEFTEARLSFQRDNRQGEFH